jgi:hypothetical protein
MVRPFLSTFKGTFMSKKPRNDNLKRDAEALVKQNTEQLKARVVQSVQSVEEQLYISSYCEPALAAMMMVTPNHPRLVELRMRKAFGSSDNLRSGRDRLIACSFHVNPPKEPEHLRNCIRVFASPDGRVKGRSKRGWTELSVPESAAKQAAQLAADRAKGREAHRQANIELSAMYSKWRGDRPHDSYSYGAWVVSEAAYRAWLGEKQHNPALFDQWLQEVQAGADAMKVERGEEAAA